MKWQVIKMTNYDAWLEKPYQDAYKAEERYYEAEEAYLDSETYKEDLDDWLETTEGGTEESFRASKTYVSFVEHFADGYFEPDNDAEEWHHENDY